MANESFKLGGRVVEQLTEIKRIVLDGYRNAEPSRGRRRRGGGGGQFPPPLRGRLDGTLSKDGSATMSVWAWNGSSEADTGENVTVYDHMLATGQTVTSGKDVVAAWFPDSGRYYVIAAECVTP